MTNLFTIFSLLSTDVVIGIIWFLGFCFLERNHYLRLSVLLLVGIALNVLLKNLFQIPLAPHLHKDWWAFPSGHAQLSATFYGYLIYLYPRKLTLVTNVIIILGISCSLVYFRYHTPFDVIAGVITAGLWIVLFELLRTATLFKGNFALLAILFLPFMALVHTFVAKVPGSYTFIEIVYTLLVFAICLRQKWAAPSKLALSSKMR